jgi:hypothetical protein
LVLHCVGRLGQPHRLACKLFSFGMLPLHGAEERLRLAPSDLARYVARSRELSSLLGETVGLVVVAEVVEKTSEPGRVRGELGPPAG